LRVFRLQLLEFLKLCHLNAGVLALPLIKCRLADPVLPADVRDRLARLLLP
jgi:hypothetical protein